MKRIWRNHQYGIVLASLLAGSWTLHSWAGWRMLPAGQSNFGLGAVWAGGVGYALSSAHATSSNWHPEFIPLLALAALASMLILRGSDGTTRGEPGLKPDPVRGSSRDCRRRR